MCKSSWRLLRKHRVETIGGMVVERSLPSAVGSKPRHRANNQDLRSCCTPANIQMETRTFSFNSASLKVLPVRGAMAVLFSASAMV